LRSLALHICIAYQRRSKEQRHLLLTAHQRPEKGKHDGQPQDVHEIQAFAGMVIVAKQKLNA
jgi:hypothetical protein